MTNILNVCITFYFVTNMSLVNYLRDYCTLLCSTKHLLECEVYFKLAQVWDMALSHHDSEVKLVTQLKG